MSNLYAVCAVQLLFLLSGLSRMQSSSGDWANWAGDRYD